MVAAGALHHEVLLLRRTKVDTIKSSNEPIYDWVPRFSFWASIRHESEDETFTSAQRKAHRAVTFRTHWFSDIDPADKLECGGIVYDVKGWRDVGLRRGIEIKAEAELPTAGV